MPATPFHTQGTAWATRSATPSHTPGIGRKPRALPLQRHPVHVRAESAVGRGRSHARLSPIPSPRASGAPGAHIQPSTKLLLDLRGRLLDRAGSRPQRVCRRQHRARDRRVANRTASLSNPRRRPDLRDCRQSRAPRDRCESPQGTLRWRAIALSPQVPTREEWAARVLADSVSSTRAATAVLAMKLAPTSSGSFPRRRLISTSAIRRKSWFDSVSIAVPAVWP